jgi:hypothetical protein
MTLGDIRMSELEYRELERRSLRKPMVFPAMPGALFNVPREAVRALPEGAWAGAGTNLIAGQKARRRRSDRPRHAPAGTLPLLAAFAR